MSKLCTALLLFVSLWAQAQVNYSLLFQSGIQEESAISNPEDLDAQAIESARFGSYFYVLLQFSDIPNVGQKESLAQQGVTLYTYIPNYAYIARIADHTDLASLPVRGIFPLNTKHKLSQSLAAGDFPIYALEGNAIRLDLTIFPDIDRAIILQRLVDRGYQPTDEGTSLSVAIPLYDMDWLASQPYTLYLDIAPPNPETEPDGLKARAMQRVNRMSRGPGTGYDGEGVTVAIGDDGAVNHPDINDRLIDLTKSDFGVHAEMTSGILAGSGNIDPMAMGMAPSAWVKLLDIDGYPQIFDAIDHYEQERVVISSTSFGEGCGGIYSVNTRFIDRQIYDYPQLLHVFSAGNNATHSCSNTYGRLRSPDGLHFGNISGGMKAGKNVVAVGNVELYDYLQIRSSRGPASDGRIKPDISAMGQGQYTLGENGAYQYGGGTSAAAPSFAGTAATLYQAYREDHNGDDPNSDLIKALLLNTADDLGRRGPDYEYGWGRVNGARALEALQNKQFIRGTIQNNRSRNHTIQVPSGVGNLRVMVYWHDPAGSPLAGQALVNDIDVQMEAPSGQQLLPWVLSTVADYDSLTKPAWRGTDHINNVEQITMLNPTVGRYTINIHGNLIAEGPQSYVLVYYFEPTEMAVTYPVAGDGLVPGEEVVVRWDALPENGTFQLQYSTNNGGSWKTIATNIPSTARHRAWNIPNQLTTQARLRLRRSGKTVVSETFGIIGQPDFTINYYDDDNAEMTWEAIAGATSYDIYQLLDGFMTKVGSTSNLSFMLPQKNAWESNWYSISANNKNDNISGLRSVAKNYVHRFCEREVTLTLQFDFYPAETRWEIISEHGDVLTSGGPYPGTLANEQIQINECLPSGCFDFVVYDAFGDGMCCTSGDGFYRIVDEQGNLLISGGKFNAKEIKPFCLGSTSNLDVQIQENKSISCAGAADGTLYAIASGTTSPVTYSWNTGQTESVITGLAAGTYSVTIDDGSQTSTAVYVLDEPTKIAISLFAEHNECAQDKQGAINAIVEGGIPPYHYAWSNGRSTSRVSDLPGGTYQLTITDQNECVAVASANILEPSPIEIDVFTQDPSCSDASDGEITLAIVGGEEPYSILWGHGVNGLHLDNLIGGNYTVTVTDDQGCSVTKNIRLTPPPSLQLSIIQEEASCETTAEKLRAVVTGGYAPYQYLWSDGTTESHIENPTRSSYNLTVTDANGCTVEETVRLSQTEALQVDIIQSDPQCAFEENGMIQLVVSGGAAPYQYQWSDGFRGSERTALGDGIYRITVTDSRGCTMDAQVVLRDPVPLEANMNVEELSCALATDGGIEVIASGGVGPYTYQWNDGYAGEIRSHLSPGLYRATITDANDCQVIKQVVLSAPKTVEVELSVTPISCYGATDGRIQVFVTGGSGPYSYQWGHTNGGGNNAASLSSGVYELVVTDANGCSVERTITLTEPDELALEVDLIAPGCGQPFGTATALPAGGTPPFSFQWSNGSRQQQATNLRSGNYQVTVTDVNGCEANQTITLDRRADLDVNLEITHPTCPDSRDGRIRALVTGGDGTYTYHWSVGGSLPVRSQLGAGHYVLTVSDESGCEIVEDIHLMAPESPFVDQVVTNLSCSGANDGSIQIDLSSSLGTYEVAWSNGSNVLNQNALQAGTYTVTVTNRGGCTFSETFIITEPDSLILDAQLEDISCTGNVKGNITLEVTGGSAPYTYAWSHDDDDRTVSDLSAGTYEVTVTDNNGCQVLGLYTISTSGNLSLAFDILSPSCTGEADGFVTPVVSGGSGTYLYSWSDGSSGAQLSDVPAGSYSLTVTDLNGCMISGQVNVDDPLPLEVSSHIQDAGLGVNGSVELTVTGGQSPYTYSWASGENTDALFNVPAGSYEVTVTDASGCSVTSMFDIMQSDQTYCDHYARSAQYEWIDGISIGAYENESGIDRGYGDYTHQIIDLKAGQSYDLSLRPGYGLREYYENWYIWIDLNGDRDFLDEGELVVHVREKGAYQGSIELPPLDHSITTRMRVAMRFLDDPTVCGAFSYGEVEDYTVYLNAGEPSYCSSLGTQTSFDWIESIGVNGNLINSGNNGGYADHTDKPVFVNRLSPLALRLTVGHRRNVSDQYWRVWIDYNKDGVFGENEEVVAARAYESTLTANLALPSGLQTGIYRMRVALKWGLPPDPCETFYWGEVEDLALQIHNEAEGWFPAVIQPTSGLAADDRTKSLGLQAYPNPTSGMVNLQFYTEGKWYGRCTVLNTLGEIVHAVDLGEVKGHQHMSLHLNHLPAGWYQIHVGNEVLPVHILR